MKYFIRILIVLILAAGVVFGVYYYQHGHLFPERRETVSLTTVSKQPATEKYAKRTLLASLEKEEIYLYKSLSDVILSFKGEEYEYNNWSSAIDDETPELYYVNIDDDKSKELIVKAVSGQDTVTGEFVYDFYVLNPRPKGEKGFDVAIASQALWKNLLDNSIVAELSQLKNCKKILQMAMTYKGENIKYNKETGLAEDCYMGYASALRGKNGSYLTLNSWEKGKGVYKLTKKNKIAIEVEVNALYDEVSEYQQLGKIHLEIELKDNNFRITSNSIVFRASDSYKVSKPKTADVVPWSYSLKNSGKADGNGEIKWLKYTLEPDGDTLSQTENLSGESTDVKYTSNINLTEGFIELKAKDGYVFNAEPSSKGDFSTVINRGAKDEYDIAYTASVEPDGKTLRIVFDGDYSADEIKSLDISYGSR